MSRNEVRADVICSVCGRKLRGIASMTGGFFLRVHKNPETGRSCFGRYRTDHRPVAS